LLLPARQALPPASTRCPCSSPPNVFAATSSAGHLPGEEGGLPAGRGAGSARRERPRRGAGLPGAGFQVRWGQASCTSGIFAWLLCAALLALYNRANSHLTPTPPPCAGIRRLPSSMCGTCWVTQRWLSSSATPSPNSPWARRLSCWP
jgi:hypothetical protein